MVLSHDDSSDPERLRAAQAGLLTNALLVIVKLLAGYLGNT